MTRNIVAKIVALAGVAAFFVALKDAPAQAQQEFGSPELIAAAKAEGKLVYYTANFAEVEQQVIKAFNKRFPEIRIEMVRAPGGQLITRVKTEAAAGTGATNEIAGTLIERNGTFGLVDVGGGQRFEVALQQAVAAGEKIRIALRPENIALGKHGGSNAFNAQVLERRYQGTQTVYDIDLFGRRLEVLELGTAARHQVGTETSVSLPREGCWAYRDTGPASYD